MLTAILTGLTLYFALVGILVEPFRELLIVVEGAVIAELILTKLADVFSKPRILLRPMKFNGSFGFSVQVKDKNIQEWECSSLLQAS